MSQLLLECIPNFSEGRRPEVIQAIADAIAAVPDVKLLHTDPGHDANRTVYTFVGTPTGVVQAATQASLVALQHIDMRTHHGTHPRIGAVDVFPFVPIGDATMAHAIQAAQDFASRIAAHVPVYFYEYNATAPQRQNLAWLRKGEYEGLQAKMLQPDFQPDLGSSQFNPKSGILITGARKFLLAYNVNLRTSDVSIAKKIAADIRSANPNSPFRYLKAIGWYIADFDRVQVSTNITDVDQVPVHEVFETIKKLAIHYGTEATGSELVGLVPEHVLLRAGAFYAPKASSTAEKIQAAATQLHLSEVKPFDPNRHILEWAYRQAGL